MSQQKRYRSIFQRLSENVSQSPSNPYTSNEDHEESEMDSSSISRGMTPPTLKRFKISPTQRLRSCFPKLQIEPKSQSSPRNAFTPLQCTASKKLKYNNNTILEFNTSLDSSAENYCDDLPSSGDSTRTTSSTQSCQETLNERQTPFTDNVDSFYKTWGEFLSLSGTSNRSFCESSPVSRAMICREKHFGRCRKNGYLKELKKAIDDTIRDNKFLSHDKRLGLREGHQLAVLNVVDSFGVHLAEVRFNDENTKKTYYIVLDEEQAKIVKPNTKLESFFCDDSSYVFQTENNDNYVIYVQPEHLFLID